MTKKIMVTVNEALIDIIVKWNPYDSEYWYIDLCTLNEFFLRVLKPKSCDPLFTMALDEAIRRVAETEELWKHGHEQCIEYGSSLVRCLNKHYQGYGHSDLGTKILKDALSEAFKQIDEDLEELGPCYYDEVIAPWYESLTRESFDGLMKAIDVYGRPEIDETSLKRLRKLIHINLCLPLHDYWRDELAIEHSNYLASGYDGDYKELIEASLDRIYEAEDLWTSSNWVSLWRIMILAIDLGLLEWEFEDLMKAEYPEWMKAVGLQFSYEKKYLEKLIESNGGLWRGDESLTLFDDDESDEEESDEEESEDEESDEEESDED
jgi:hypothetical protein